MDLTQAGGLGVAQVKGSASRSFWSPSWLTILNERAALENNEMVNQQLSVSK
jgi:hypothetical protein